MTTIPKTDVLCEKLLNAIKPYLKSPFSAVLCSEKELSFSPMFGESYIVRGYVNSQNSYGAMMKTDFSATATFTNDDWTVSGITVGRQTMKENAKTFTINFIAISIFVTIMGFIGYAVLSAMIH